MITIRLFMPLSFMLQLHMWMQLTVLTLLLNNFLPIKGVKIHPGPRWAPWAPYVPMAPQGPDGAAYDIYSARIQPGMTVTSKRCDNYSSTCSTSPKGFLIEPRTFTLLNPIILSMLMGNRARALLATEETLHSHHRAPWGPHGAP